MQFDAALAAQETFRQAEVELGSDWDTAVELEGTFFLQRRRHQFNPPPLDTLQSVTY